MAIGECLRHAGVTFLVPACIHLHSFLNCSFWLSFRPSGIDAVANAVLTIGNARLYLEDNNMVRLTWLWILHSLHRHTQMLHI